MYKTHNIQGLDQDVKSDTYIDMSLKLSYNIKNLDKIEEKMHIHIPRQGALVTVETTDEALGNIPSLNIAILREVVYTPLAIMEIARRCSLPQPATLYGIPFEEAASKLLGTAKVLSGKLFEHDFKFYNQQVRSMAGLHALFLEMGYLTLDDMLKPVA